MNGFIERLIKIKRKLNSRKRSRFVKKYYKENRNIKVDISKNIWNGNFYWDFFFHSMPNAIQSSLYVPNDYYNYKIERNLNDYATVLFVKDKNMYDRIFGGIGVKLPKTIFRCYNNVFMDHDYNSIHNINEFVNTINHDVIVKQADYLQGGGENVEKYRLLDNNLVNFTTNETLDPNKLKENLKGNYIVQEVIQQHNELGKFHEPSLNTFKVYSYRSVKTNQVHIVAVTFRVGVNNSFLDNASNGGLMVGVKFDEESNEAKLREFAFDQWGKYINHHPNSMVNFKDCVIPNFSLIVKSVKRLANLVPYQRLIGWDYSINSEGDPVLIELNIGSGVWGHQVANGEPLFGKFSSEIKEYLDRIS